MAREWDEEFPRIMAMMGLFFLVVCAVGILRPIKNALALDGLGDTDFYKVYLVSAAVVFFVWPYNRLSDRISWRWLIPSVALFFALHLLLFRIFYQDGSAAFGMLFYGWYDLFAAALVTQFFMATQLFFNARDAKRAYPLVIAGGAIGATLGGAITGFFAQRVGTPNLLLVAAGLIAAFAAGLPFVWAGDRAVDVGRASKPKAELQAGELVRIFRNPQVRLIAVSVLITILVKQLVDYEFNTLTKEVFSSRDAMSAFQGKFNAATQWLPLVVLAGLRPLLRRWGVGVAVFLLPVAMLASNVALAISFGLAAAVAAKGSDAALRYSAERTGREILYVPVPDDIKLKAKTYIDVAVEKGVGKVASALLIMGLLAVMSYRDLPFVAVGLAGLWLAVAVAIRREYVRTLARSFEGRFASLRGVFASLTELRVLPALERALTGGDTLQVGFTLDLLEQAEQRDVRPLTPALMGLLDHPVPEVRERALRLLAGSGGDIAPERLRPLLDDPAEGVREAAVVALCSTRPEGAMELLSGLLDRGSPPARVAALWCIARRDVPTNGAHLVTPAFVAERRGRSALDPEARIELALAAAAAADGADTDRTLEALMVDPHPAVASAALRGAGLLGRQAHWDTLIRALGRAGVREAARDALAGLGAAVVAPLERVLCDPAEDATVRRNIPAVLARIPVPESVDALLRSVLAPETDQLLDYRTLKALNKLRAKHPDLRFDGTAVRAIQDAEAAAAVRYGSALAVLSMDRREAGSGRGLLQRALVESQRERRESIFRCIGLLQPPEEVYHCCLAVLAGGPKARGNALEWLEQHLGHTRFSSLAPALEGAAVAPPGTTPERIIEQLRDDADPWIARVAAWNAHSLRHVRTEGVPMDLIEKVFLLQGVDLLEGARSSHLALLASIAEEIDEQPGEVLLRRGEPTDALYIVVRGRVLLRGAPEGEIEATDGMAFGTWALIDESPSVVEARVEGGATLLRIGRTEFHDLLADNPELGIGLLQGLARRVRTLVA